MRSSVTRQDQAGVSLVELLVAVLVLSIAVVGLLSVYTQSATSAGADRDRVVADLVARNRAEEMTLGSIGLPGRVTMAGRDWVVSTDRRTTSGGFSEVTIRVTPADGGAGSTLVTYLAETR